jgi:N-methylhydantoinase B
VFDAKGNLVLFASIQAHHADTAGMMPGGYPADAMDIWAEGFRCPAVKLVDGGEWRKDVIYLFHTNNRVPTYEGDLKSQIGAAQLGARQCRELIDKYGAATVSGAIDAMIQLSERRFREEIATWPDGTYEADSFFDHDVKGTTDVKVHCTVQVKGDELLIDFTGSDDRQWLQAWSTRGNTRSMTMAQLCSMIDASIPKNEGLFNPVTIVYPENTIVNPPLGKPVSMGTHHPGCEISEAVALALSKAIPEKSIPQVYKAAMPTVLFGAKANGEFFIDHSVDVTSTAAAAGYEQDGWGCTNAGFGNLIMATAEINEAIFPNRHLGNDLQTDSGGPGKWRGQCGSFYVKEATMPQSLYTFVVGMKYPSQGIHGARNGTPNRLKVKVGGDGAYEVTHTALYVPIEPGERLEYDWGGGGGWGDPLERDPDKVRDDVLDEYVSLEGAEREYGVVLTGKLEDYSLEVDEKATERKRGEILSARAGS